MVKVAWTDSAISDLNNIGEHIAKDSERYAQLTVERLFNSVDILEKFSPSGKMAPEFENDKIRELIRIVFRIVYHIINEFRVDIFSVHRCERLFENVLDFSDFEND